MKAARLHNYNESVPQDSLRAEEIDEPKIEGLFDVIVCVSAPPGSAALTSTSSGPVGFDPGSRRHITALRPRP